MSALLSMHYAHMPLIVMLSINLDTWFLCRLRKQEGT